MRKTILILTMLALTGLSQMSVNAQTASTKNPASTEGWSQTAKDFLTKAEQGDAESQNKLGVCYYGGKVGVTKDPIQAVYWFRKAADQGYVAAQNNLGNYYRYGETEDPTQAVYWYRKAAEQGYADAQYELGYCYRFSYGVTKDNAQAEEWYRKAAEQGHDIAQSILTVGWMQEAKDDFPKAIKGDKEAQYKIGWYYRYGSHDVPENFVQAVYWYRKAAEQGYAEAQYELGYCYMGGNGVAEDETQAVSWYRKAAEQGHADAQLMMGHAYSRGSGVKQDYDIAISWYKKVMENKSADEFAPRAAEMNIEYIEEERKTK